MGLRSIPSLLLMFLGFCCMLPACGQRRDAKAELKTGELSDIQEMWFLFVKAHNKAPTQAGDLKQYEVTQPFGYKALQEGKYVMVWGVKDKSPSILLAYEKDAPKEGGAVLMSD